MDATNEKISEVRKAISSSDFEYKEQIIGLFNSNKKMVDAGIELLKGTQYVFLFISVLTGLVTLMLVFLFTKLHHENKY